MVTVMESNLLIYDIYIILCSACAVAILMRRIIFVDSIFSSGVMNILSIILFS